MTNASRSDDRLTLMAVLAHPDDESLGVGPTLAKYAAEGVDVHLVTATRGERGRYFTNEDRPSDEEVGRAREAELRLAGAELGLAEIAFLDYLDGDLDEADPMEAAARIAEHVRRVRPQVVVTFDPFGAYGHPDHVAICQLTGAALQVAASSGSGDHPAHRVSKLYWFASDHARWTVYQDAFKRLGSRVDGVERDAVEWPDWSISARLDTRDVADRVWRAVQCHGSQLAGYRALEGLSPQQFEVLWGTQTLYRVFSTVNGGRRMESDLFQGLR